MSAAVDACGQGDFDGFESNEEKIEPGQHGKATDHCLGRNVPGLGNCMKLEANKVSGRQR